MAHVLVIDDDAHVREGLRALLTTDGHTIQEADDPVGAARAMADTAGVDVILLDLWLPREDGVNLLRDLRARDDHTPVVVMSGGGATRSLEQALAMADASGADATLIKPFTNDELRAALHAVMASGPGDGG